MQENAFAGHAKQPSKKELTSALGSTLDLWTSLAEDLKSELKIDTAEWNSSSIKMGWSFRLQIKKRNILYLGPRDGWFLASLILGDKAVAKSRAASLPPEVHKLIAEGKRYPEGTAIRIEVKSGQDVELVKILARIKAEN